jgi:hypothetical protein
MTGVNRMVQRAASEMRVAYAKMAQQVVKPPKVVKACKPWNQRWAEGSKRKADEVRHYVESFRDSFNRYPNIDLEGGLR